MACLFYSPLEDGREHGSSQTLTNNLDLFQSCIKRSGFLLEIRSQGLWSYLYNSQVKHNPCDHQGTSHVAGTTDSGLLT